MIRHRSREEENNSLYTKIYEDFFKTQDEYVRRGLTVEEAHSRTVDEYEKKFKRAKIEAANNRIKKINKDLEEGIFGKDEKIAKSRAESYKSEQYEDIVQDLIEENISLITEALMKKNKKVLIDFSDYEFQIYLLSKN